MILADTELAQRVEQAETRLTVSIGEEAARHNPESAAFVIRVGSGAAVYAGQGSPANKIIGVGIGETPETGLLDEIERSFFARCAPVQAEISTLALPSVQAMFTARGYFLQGFENVLGRRLSEADAAEESPGEIAIEPVAAKDMVPWMDVVITAFENPDHTGAGSGVAPPNRRAIEEAFTQVSRAGGFRAFAASIGDCPAGGGSLRIDAAGVAQLCGASTLPAYRRRGVQGALLRHRLRQARLAGCDLAVMTAQPGSRSHFNAQRQGFSLLYSRAILVKEGD
jgi:ribosomal protein S18 acetylase RimI-like enzyme